VGELATRVDQLQAQLVEERTQREGQAQQLEDLAARVQQLEGVQTERPQLQAGASAPGGGEFSPRVDVEAGAPSAEAEGQAPWLRRLLRRLRARA
jgi:hypothetical protein